MTPERTVLFGPERNLVATLTSGAAGQPQPRYAVVLTNVGIMPRCGPYRMNVEIARRFAALGVPSIRFDQGGLGDSARSADPLPHHQQRVAETRAALDEAQRAFGVEQFVMVGVCAGADIAYLTAPEEPRLRGLVMFDPYLYPNAKAKRLAWQRRFHTLGPIETARALSRSVMRRLRPPPVVESGPDAAPPPLKYGRSSIPDVDTFGARMATIVNGGARVLLVTSGSFPYDHNYREQFVDVLRPFGIADRIEVEHYPDADHVLLGVPGRERFVARAIEFAQQT